MTKSSKDPVQQTSGVLSGASDQRSRNVTIYGTVKKIFHFAFSVVPPFDTTTGTKY